MKEIITLLILIGPFACSDDKNKNVGKQDEKDPLEVPKLDVQTKKPINSTQKPKIKHKFSDRQ